MFSTVRREKCQNEAGRSSDIVDNLFDVEWLFFSPGLCERNIQTPQVPPQGAAGWQEPRTWEHKCLLSAPIRALSTLLAPKAFCSRRVRAVAALGPFLPALLGACEPDGLQSLSSSSQASGPVLAALLISPDRISP